MAQISRPFQIAFAALLLFVGVWFVALRGHSSSSGGAGSTPAASSSSAAHPANPAAPSSVYHGSVPGLHGLTKAIAKAHGAVAASEQNAKQLRAQSGSSTVTRAASPAKSASPAASAGRAGASPLGVAVRQQLVERALARGELAAILFWNPKGAEDRAVQLELRRLHASSRGAVATFQAYAGEVASFGSVTRGVQVSQTPTLLVVGKGGKTIVLTGYTDAYAIRQTLQEARAG